MNLNAAIQALYDYLTKHGPYRGYSYALAQAAGIPSGKIHFVLGHVRSPQFIEENHWTVPYVGQGTGMKNPFMVVEGRAEAHAYLHPGTRIRGTELLSMLRRWDAQMGLGLVQLHGNTAEGKWNKVASAQARAMIQMAEALGL